MPPGHHVVHFFFVFFSFGFLFNTKKLNNFIFLLHSFIPSELTFANRNSKRNRINTSMYQYLSNRGRRSNTIFSPSTSRFCDVNEILMANKLPPRLRTSPSTTRPICTLYYNTNNDNRASPYAQARYEFNECSTPSKEPSYSYPVPRKKIRMHHENDTTPE